MSATPVPLEVEAKLAVASERELRTIAALGQIGPWLLLRRGTARLHSVYYDTESLVLARHGIALRARRRQRRWELTLKWSGHVSGAVHARPELTEPLAKAPGPDGLTLPETFHQHVDAYLAGRALRPTLVTDIRRELLDVVAASETPSRLPAAELALDRVHLRAPEEADASASYCEVEIEQKAGERQDVAGLARLLQERFHLAPSPDTKFSHGMALLYGPQLAAYDPPAGDGTVRAAAQRLVRRYLARLRHHDPGTRLGRDPESLHDMRVALRRLRAVFRFLADAFPPQRREHLRTELRWLSDVLSPVRDCDVQLQALHRYESALSLDRRRALVPYREHIVRDREVHRAALLAALASKRYFTLLQRLEQFADDRRPPRDTASQAPAASVGRRSLKHAFKSLLRQGNAVAAAPRPEELHRTRIRAKRLRYLLESFRASSGKAGRRLLEDLVRLQDLLGAHNDAVVAAAALERWVHGPGKGAESATMLTLGGLLQEEHRRARKARAKFHRTWKRFASKRTLADWKAVHRRLSREALAVSARRSTSPARGAKKPR